MELSNQADHTGLPEFLDYKGSGNSAANTEPSRLLRILLLSDIHLHFEYLKQLMKWHMETNLKFDYVLISGDLAAINNGQENGVSSLEAS